jgi:hypothetical protein
MIHSSLSIHTFVVFVKVTFFYHPLSFGHPGHCHMATNNRQKLLHTFAGIGDKDFYHSSGLIGSRYLYNNPVPREAWQI